MSRIGMIAVVACLHFATTAHAGVVDFTRTTSPRVSGAASELTFEEEDGTTALGPFSRELADDITNEGGSTRALARQTSDVSLSGAGSATGEVESQVAEFGGNGAEGFTSFILTFRVVDEAATLQLDGSVAASQHGEAQVMLSSVGQGVLFDGTIEQGNPTTFDFGDTFTLAPGQYSLSGSTRAIGTPEGGAASFDLTFAFDDNGGGGNVIPLPPAVAPGLVALAALAWRIKSRRLAV